MKPARRPVRHTPAPLAKKRMHWSKKVALTAAAAAALGYGGWRVFRKTGKPIQPLNPPVNVDPGNHGRRPTDIDPGTPTRNGRQPSGPGPTNQGEKVKTRAQRLEEVFKANENVRLKDKKFPFVPRELSFLAAKKVIADVLEKNWGNQRYDFRHPSWQMGQGSLNEALQKAPVGSILQLSRYNPEKGVYESSFMVKTDDDFYYYAFLTDKGALRGDSGSILNPVLNSTGSQVIGIYSPNP